MPTPASDLPRSAEGEPSDGGGHGDVGVLEAEPPASEAPVDGDHDERRAKSAAIAFGVYVAVAAPLLLLVLGRHLWFFHDEWEFIVRRLGDGPSEIFEPHNEHWTTIPILLYKAIYAVVGLHSYVPYQAVVVAAHLGAAVLLRVVMRRAGVDPWIATIAAAIFVLFGTGERNIVGAFQIAFTGALFFGLLHLVLADHDGRVEWRDAAGLLAGALALMFSGIGVAMAVVVGLAMWLRRGWRVALLHTVPLAAIYLTWSWVVDPSTPRWAGYSFEFVARRVASFVATGLGHTFDALGYLPWVGVLLVVLLVVGLVVAWLPLTFTEFRRQAALSAALLVGAVIFMTITGAGRWIMGSNTAEAGRYAHLIAAFILPALAVAADAVIRRWRMAAPAVVVLLLIGIPGNIAEFGNDKPRTAAFFERNEALIVGMARSPYASRVDPDMIPYPAEASSMTVGWLLAAEADGDLPDAPPPDHVTAAQIEVRLGLSHTSNPLFGARCQEIEDHLDVALEWHDAFRFGPEPVTIVNLKAAPVHREPLIYDARYGFSLIVQLSELELRLAPKPPATSFTYCS